jgi:tetratricopeptide (TPR) repeat protein
MKRLLAMALVLGACSAFAAVFERFLNPSVPKDKAILGYLQMEKEGKAQSNDLAELAVLLAEKGFPKDAETYLRKALKLSPENVEARYRLGLVLQRLGKDWAAAREYRRVIKARPGFAEAQFMLGLALERCGRRHAAVKAFAKAYKHNPQLADPRKNPLVLDSKLQSQARLLRYQKEVASSTLPLQPLDPEAVRRMLLAQPPPAASPTPKPAAPPDNPPPSASSLPPTSPPEAPPGPGRRAAEQREEAGTPTLPALANASAPLRVRR